MTEEEFRPPLPEGWHWETFENEGSDWWVTARGKRNTMKDGHMKFPKIVGHGITRQEAIDVVLKGITELGGY